ncbi:Calcium-dependent protein kinase 34 [Camellia lanceoleosa]|uniref:Calcium-dependent protein kinase 34 n=1 Tax=Camellia lanceoleosa TaxID=1840588 RepID=A0ACC0IWR4_9ERIC|nr:Calcium-dependent protein kinase 34 [Camellia lanceoleosa]
MGNCCSHGNNDSDPMNTDNTTSKEGSANPNPDPNNPETAGATDHPKTTPPSASPNPSSKPSKAAAIGPVLGHPMEDVKSIYSVGKELGRGQFGVTHLLRVQSVCVLNCNRDCRRN